MALSLSETLGPIISSKDPSEMRGGTFTRVRVSLNILEPICQVEGLLLGRTPMIRFRSCTSDYQIYAIGVVCLLMMIRSVQPGYGVKVCLLWRINSSESS